MLMLKKAKVFIITFITSILILLDTTYFISAESNTSMKALPDSVLFDVTNMKPGDWTVKTYTVSNNSSENGNYLLTSQFTEGSKKLYNQLQLTITEGNNMLYHGSVRDFNGFALRELEVADADQFEFRIDFPYESGNDYQGLATHFVILLQTEERMVDAAVHNDRLPNTAGLMFRYLFIGAVLLLLGGTILYRAYRKDRRLV